MSGGFLLSDIAAALPGARLVNGISGATVDQVAISSAHVKPGTLFAAIPGSVHDGHSFIADAKARGASAFLVSRQDVLATEPGIVVENTRVALSILADFWYQHPSKNLSLVGVTGTNGKTTTNWMVFSLLNQLKRKAFRMGTLGFFAPEIAHEPDSLTSPDALTVHRDLSRALAGGCVAGVLEVSSHALDQYRMRDVRLNAAIFTNLTRDHLDYHKTMEHYLAAKLKIIDLIDAASKGSMIVNGDDPFAHHFVTAAREKGIRAVSFGTQSTADAQIINLSNEAGRSTFTLKFADAEYQIDSPFIGLHNAQNLLGAILALESLGYPIAEQLKVLPAVSQVPGRLEYVGQRGVHVYVDYAHTPDALESVLRVLKPLTHGKLWAICGCGGDRDRGKRPQMARIAATLADKAVFTSDNPRTEDPHAILADMTAEGVVPEILEPDRALAIERTLTQAVSGDTVIIAGKGHEDYQIIGTTKYPFSDVAVVKRFFECKEEAGS